MLSFYAHKVRQNLETRMKMKACKAHQKFRARKARKKNEGT